MALALKTPIIKNFRGKARNLASFIVPKKIKENKKSSQFNDHQTVVLVPTYKPSYLTKCLVENLYNWYQNIEIIIVDDSNAKVSSKHQEMFKKLKKLARRNRVHYLKTPQNLHKAGALNYGFKYVKEVLNTKNIKTIITLDDDVIITQKTIPSLLNKIYSSPNIGAVCCLVRAKNKNKNLACRFW